METISKDIDRRDQASQPPARTKGPTPVARMLDIHITQKDWQTKQPVKVEATPSPEETYDAKGFVENLFPGAKVIYLGRERLLGREPSSYRGKQNFSLFFQTLQKCFNAHHPFAFRPETLWYLIAHEAAVTVKKNPEAYRRYFTDSDQKKLLEIVQQAPIGWRPDNWEPFIDEFCRMLRENMPSALGDMLLPSFSTSTAESSAATAVTLMEAASPFYDYRMRLACGLPKIRLDGAPGDYAKLVEGAQALAQPFAAHLGPYFRHLTPVLRTIADQAAGAPVDHAFWGSIYNKDSGSGGSDGSDGMGGWITTFVNYVRVVEGGWGDGPVRAELQAKPAEAYDWNDGKRWLAVGMAPNHVSSADFVLQDHPEKAGLVEALGFQVDTKMKFIGGVLGVEIDDGYVSPQLSYGVLEEAR